MSRSDELAAPEGDDEQAREDDRVGLDDTSPAPEERSLFRLLLWSSLDLDPRGLAADAASLVGGVALVAALAVLYLLGQGWQHMPLVQLFTVVAGLGVGVVGSFDLVSRRPMQLVVPLAQTLIAVLALTIAVRVAVDLVASRTVLAWSLGLHLCLVPLSARLWAIWFNERASSKSAERRRELLASAEAKKDEVLVVRVLDVDGGLSEVEIIGGAGAGVLRLSTALLSPRPRPARVYVLEGAVVINRTVPGSEEQGEWSRYLVGVRETALLGDRAVVGEPREAATLARRAVVMLLVMSAFLTAVSLIAALG